MSKEKKYSVSSYFAPEGYSLDQVIKTYFSLYFQEELYRREANNESKI